ncbi:cytochrome c-type biogenesis protein CcmH [Aestuariibius sp. HNIBRBA575]|uniref:cytochrome c-type biogenesis protein n=1 Tax=Aestuariibius sp. HNIBRBA575 TaxID=3233343 RepID=UPI0034A405DF
MKHLIRHLVFVLTVLVAIASPVWAVQPDEILDDPVLERRARDISAGLRCPVCQNESIDESNATLARDLRILLRERLVAGDSDADAIAYIVDRYGEYVLLKPTTSGANWILWLAGPAVLLMGLGIGYKTVRKRAQTGASETLSDAEKARLEEILHR